MGINTNKLFNCATMKHLILLIGLVLFTKILLGQNESPNTNGNMISKEAYDTIIQKQFTRIVTGQSPTNYSNYVSFDPIDANFSANAFFNITKRINSNINVKGGLLENKISSILYTDGNINTTSSADIKFNLRIDKMWVTADSKDIIFLKRQKALLKTKLNNDTILAVMKVELYPLNLAVLRKKNTEINDSIKKTDSIIGFINNKFKDCTDDACREVKSNLLYKPNNKKIEFINDRMKTSFQIDSISQLYYLDQINEHSEEYIDLGGQKYNYRMKIKNDIKENYDKNVLKLEKNLKIPSINIFWITPIGGISDQSFKSYDSKALFDNQIKTNSLISYNYGLDFNWFRRDSSFRQCIFINAGGQYKFTNNLTDLTSFVINQQTLISNNNINRTLKKDYTVYADSLVKKYYAVYVYINYIEFFGKRQTNAIHINPTCEYRNTAEDVYSGLIGYIHSFNNSKSGKGILNTEIYVKFNDISNALKSDDVFEKRIQIGVSFALPINININ